MTDVKELFERQEVWQKRRAKSLWEEKLRMAEVMQETLIAFRNLREAEKAAREEHIDERSDEADSSHSGH